MHNPTLSIIVPVYKVEAYLARCVDAILSQSFTDFELILVDDGSPDNCGRMCDDYASRDLRIKVIHKPNGGLSSARNAGLDMARGAYITFVDSDDTISGEAYALNMPILLNNKEIDLLEYPAYVYYQSAEAHLWKEKEQSITGKENIFAYWIETGGYTHSYSWNKIYRRSLFNTIRFPQGKVFEDVYTTPLLLKETTHYFISEHGLYYYYCNPSSITRTANYAKLSNLLESNLIIWKDLADYTISRSATFIYYIHIVNVLIDTLGYKDGDSVLNKQHIKELSGVRFSLKELIGLDIPKRAKYKNIPLVLAGLPFHCKLYTALTKLKRRT